MSRPPEQAHVAIVGAGFAGIGCAKELAKHDAPSGGATFRADGKDPMEMPDKP